jgi:hypothetical protein
MSSLSDATGSADPRAAALYARTREGADEKPLASGDTPIAIPKQNPHIQNKEQAIEEPWMLSQAQRTTKGMQREAGNQLVQKWAGTGQGARSFFVVSIFTLSQSR